jgi:hypothetical protein
MSFLGWMSLAGGLLLLMALSSAYLRRLPVSTSAIYLAVGCAIGPLGVGWLRVDLRDATRWFERLTEVAVIVSLFVGGSSCACPSGTRRGGRHSARRVRPERRCDMPPHAAEGAPLSAPNAHHSSTET